MPDTGIQPPYLDPSQYPAYLDLQRKQMLAQTLMGAFQQANQTPADWNSMKVVPRRSGLQNVATLASALLAGKAVQGANQAQQRYFQGLYGGGDTSGAPASSATPAPSLAPPPADPNEQSVQPLIARNGQSFSQAVSGGAPQPRAPNPMLLTGDPRTSQALLGMMGPVEYGKALAGRYAPTELERLVQAAGVTDPAQRQAIIQRNVEKQNYIAPIEEREGSIERDPLSNAVIGVNPKTTTGGVNLYDSQGRYSGQALAPGAAQAIEASEKAATLGQTEGKYNILPNQGGGTTVVGGPQGSNPASGMRAPQVGGSFRGAAPESGPTGSPWGSMPKLPVSSALGAPDEFTKGTLQAAGKKHAELVDKFGSEADLADQKLQYNNEARKALGAAEVGPASEWLTENRAKLKEWGVPESLLPGGSSVTPTMELNKNLKQSALQGARAIFGSRMTQMEVRLQHEELSPSTAMTRDAIASLMQQDDIKQHYAQQRAQDYDKYRAQGGDPLRFESWYTKNFPLTRFAAKATTPQAALERLQQNPALAKDFRAKYGWLPYPGE